MAYARPLDHPLVRVLNSPASSPMARPLVRASLYGSSFLTGLAVNGVTPVLALDFAANNYATASEDRTFADAFTGNSPKLTYSTTSNSTMTNSSGEIVWAPHNLVTYSEDFSAPGSVNNSNVTLAQGYAEAPDGSMNAERLVGTGTWFRQENYTHTVGQKITVAMWVKSNTGSNQTFRLYGDNNEVSVDLTATATWQLFSHEFTVSTGGATGDGITRDTSSNDADLLIFGRHSYRSDLGGMHPVPGADTGFEYYVPTNGSAEYLPRVGHHVYNGSAWVNEGLLIESEARTNLITHSEDFTDASWPVRPGSSVTLNATGPDGLTSAFTLSDDSTTGTGTAWLDRSNTTVATSTAYSFSIFAKSDQLDGILLYLSGFTTPANDGYYFNLSTGTVDVPFSSGAGLTPNIEDYGNGWHRCSITFTTGASDTSGSLQVYVADMSGTPTATVDLDGTSSIHVYGAQLEEGSTPSSYMPTNGGTYTRTAQSLTVPANWYDADNPTYTGPELVTNGGFDTDTTGWTGSSDGELSISSGQLVVTNGSANFGRGYVSVQTEVGSIYKVSLERTGGTSSNFDVQVRNATVTGAIVLNSGVETGTGTYEYTFTAGNAVSVIRLGNATSTAGLTSNFDNISVRQVSAPQFGWPEPEYIGPELVDNGTFDSNDSSGWTDISGAWSVTGDALSGSSVPAGAYGPYVNNTEVVAGRVYRATFALSVTSGSLRIRVGNEETAAYSSSGEYSVELVALTTGVTSFQVRAGSEFTGTIDNISVREINPLSVSIQMDGRMTYADDVTDGAMVRPYRWHIDNNNRIRSRLSVVSGSDTGNWLFQQTYAATNDEVATGSNTYTPGILTPFNISSRHGSTFINGAVDGVALTEDTTPTALPDLSGTDLQVAYGFMGTIGTFRQFAGDIGDAGLVTATNPSTEPTLSLTFDGSEGSFYNLSWSE